MPAEFMMAVILQIRAVCHYCCNHVASIFMDVNNNVTCLKHIVVLDSLSYSVGYNLHDVFSFYLFHKFFATLELQKKGLWMSNRETFFMSSNNVVKLRLG